MEALIKDENAMDKGVDDIVKNHKRHHDDDDDDDDKEPLAGPNQGKKTKRRRTKDSKSSKKPSTTKETSKGKAPSKRSKTGKSASAEEPFEEPIIVVVIDDAVNTAGGDVVRNDINHKIPQYPRHTRPQTKIGLNNLQCLLILIQNGTSLYKFKEGDFVDLHLNDIEDMLLLAVQHKLFHLNDNEIVDIIVALRMFTRSLIIKRGVEDLQL
uniref:Uncharacterized protein n=1 Tax=Tanacetum cinerariifolium TaxID=118510 RepID=A0A6L2NAC6_TANCI|nr:hypothetical protein [Tanacetum cinerariifolium]